MPLIIERTFTNKDGKKYKSYVKSIMINTFSLTNNSKEAKQYKSVSKALKDLNDYRKFNKHSVKEDLRVIVI